MPNLIVLHEHPEWQNPLFAALARRGVSFEPGRRVFYDINANSNLRPSVAAAFGFDPFERVVDFPAAQLARRDLNG